MGFVEVQMEIANPREPERRAKVTLLAGTGANYSMIPRKVLEQIGVAPIERLQFEIAGQTSAGRWPAVGQRLAPVWPDGSRIHRDIGEAVFFWDSKGRTSQVIFGEQTDASVLGVIALESLALQVDPFTKQLRPSKSKLVLLT